MVQLLEVGFNTLTLKDKTQSNKVQVGRFSVICVGVKHCSVGSALKRNSVMSLISGAIGARRPQMALYYQERTLAEVEKVRKKSSGDYRAVELYLKVRPGLKETSC